MITLDDPVGAEIDSRVLENGLRPPVAGCPIGVIGVIYEARPNVTIDIASLCSGKTGNASILRGGRETLPLQPGAGAGDPAHALAASGLPEAAVQYIDNPDRALVAELLRPRPLRGHDHPPAGAGLHKMCARRTAPSPSSSAGRYQPYLRGRERRIHAFPGGHRERQGSPPPATPLDTLLVHEKVAATLLPQPVALDERAQVTLVGAQSPWRCWLAATTCATRAGRFRHRVAGADPKGQGGGGRQRGAAHMREHNAATPMPSRPTPRQCRAFRQRGAGFRRRSMSTPPPASPMAASLASGPRWRSRPRCFTPVAPWGPTELTNSYKWVGQAD